MIELITGLPGAGKTLYTLASVKERAEKENREVYYSGIADLKLPWIECDPEKWFELPKNSIFVFDECQRLYRPRANGSKVPEYVSELETHRHKGIDIVFITQHPMLVDSNVRRLVGRHFHCVRKWGTQASTIHEWSSVKENCDKSRADSIKHHWVYPKSVFGLYKSAEVHTVKARVPMKVWMLFALPVLLIGLGYGIYKTLPSKTNLTSNQVTSSTNISTPVVDGGTHKKTKSEYIEGLTPRLQQFPATAPVYDDVARPVSAPRVAMCIEKARECSCFTQQATKITTMDDVTCHQIVRYGYFDPTIPDTALVNVSKAIDSPKDRQIQDYKNPAYYPQSPAINISLPAPQNHTLADDYEQAEIVSRKHIVKKAKS